MSVKSNTNAQTGVEYQFNNADKVLKNLEKKNAELCKNAEL